MSLIINGETIGDEVVDDEFRNIKSHYERTLQVSCCERDPEFRAQAKRQITGRVLLGQQAEKTIPDIPEEEIDQALAELIEEHGGEDQFYLNMGVPSKDEPMVRHNIAASLRVHKLLEEAIYRHCPEPTDQQLRQFYADNEDEFRSTEEVRVMHISKSLRGAQSRDEVFKVMREVRQQLLDGSDFETLAKEHNDQKGQQIDLGFFKRGEFMEEFETIAFSMNTGEISPVFNTQLGYHVCTVVERHDAVVSPYGEVRERVAELWTASERQKLLDRYLEDLRADSTLEDTDPEEELREEAAALDAATP